jgi:hypothetical protein
MFFLYNTYNIDRQETNNTCNIEELLRHVEREVTIST